MFSKKRKDISSLHVPHNKNTAGCTPVAMACPKEVLLPMNMHYGAAAIPVVEVGDYVRVGQLIAKEDETSISSPVHATISGTVVEIGPLALPGGKETTAIRIESDGKMELDPSVQPPKYPENLDEFLELCRLSGVVGLGGAAFPVWKKLDAARTAEIDTVLVNGAECEPYITSDHRMMLDHSDLVADGMYMMKQFIGCKKCVICIESNKADAIALLREKFAGDDSMEVRELNTVYPQGAKQVLLYNVTGKVTMQGQRMANLGVLIINVSSLAKVAYYIRTGMPLVDRIVTVDGSAVAEPKNLIVPIGTRVSALLEEVGTKAEPGKVLIGGPMLGRAVGTLEDPIVKATSAILAMNKKDAKLSEPSACIHCGRCVAVCPMGVDPTTINKATLQEEADPKTRYEILIKAGTRQCIECACCSYVCPAHRPLMEVNKQGYAFARGYEKAQKGGVKA